MGGEEVLKKIGFILLFLLQLVNCSSPEEFPLVLPPGAEPSAKSHNDFGMEDFSAGQYVDAYLHFKQAYAADPYSGEVYFNMGLALHMKGERDRATEMFRKARQYAKDNQEILHSQVLKKYSGGSLP